MDTFVYKKPLNKTTIKKIENYLEDLKNQKFLYPQFVGSEKIAEFICPFQPIDVNKSWTFISKTKVPKKWTLLGTAIEKIEVGEIVEVTTSGPTQIRKARADED